ncbi:MAG: ORF6N domain-containing protein [bacterium]|nr:ORF6N domain-containing protein [bacterium]
MPKKTKSIIAVEEIVHKIRILRGERVMLDNDLAEMYGVETRVLKQAVRRNIDRFPDDFIFELTKKEQNSLKSQTVILKRAYRYYTNWRSHIVASS